MILPVGTALCVAILELLVKVTFLMGAALLLSSKLRPKTPSASHLVYALAFVSALTIPGLTAVLPRSNIFTYNGSFLSQSSMLVDHSSPAQVNGLTQVPSQTSFDSSTESSQGTGSHLVRWETIPTWLETLMAIWVIGILVVILRSAIGIGCLTLIRRKHSLPLRSDSLNSLLTQLKMRSGIPSRWNVRVCSNPHFSVPMTWGVFRPTIALPSDAETWSDQQFEAVMLHELAHIRRFDFSTQMIAEVACAVYWFHPIVWLGARAMRSDAELATDEAVLRTGLKPSDYASELMMLATKISAKKQPYAYAGALAMNNSKIEERLYSILKNNENRRAMTTVQALVACTAAVLVVPALAALHGSPTSGQAPTAEQSESMSRLKQTSLATMMYASDWDSVLPYTQSTASAENVLLPYAKTSKIFHSPVNGGRFEYNLNIGGVLLTALPAPAETPEWVETVQNSKAPVYVAFVDGHVAKKPLAETKKGLAVKYKRSSNSKPLPQGYMPNPIRRDASIRVPALKG